MRRTSALISALLILSVVAPTIALAKDKAKEDWEPVSNEEGVEVFRKEVEGSDVVAFKGVATADVPIGKLLAVFKDPQQRKFWVDRYVEHKTFTQSGDSETYWIHFHVPWPISDRDYVLRAEGKRNAEKRIYTVNIKSVEVKSKPEDDCCVRAQVYGTYYEFTALPDSNKTKVIVEVHTDPKGALPSWLVNLIQKSWPRKTLNGLINHAKAAKIAPIPDFADWHKKPEDKPVEQVKTSTAS
jgi:hypothetical protein